MMDKPTVAAIAADLGAEQSALDAVVAPLAADEWELATPAPRWTIRDQIGHLAFFDQAAALAINDPERFIAHRHEFLRAAFRTADAADEITLGPTRAMGTGELLHHWRTARHELDTAVTVATAVAWNDGGRVEWYGPSMGAKSFLTARLMECWAHGQDICDTVGATREPTERLRHIAQLGVITRAWTYINRKMDPPDGDVRVTLVAPSGEEWGWGPDDAADSVVGPALDFCLVAAQRRNVLDTSLVVTGALATEWLSMAQLFAGPPSQPPPPRS